jgi:hypothetical protein
MKKEELQNLVITMLKAADSVTKDTITISSITIFQPAEQFNETRNQMKNYFVMVDGRISDDPDILTYSFCGVRIILKRRIEISELL